MGENISDERQKGLILAGNMPDKHWKGLYPARNIPNKRQKVLFLTLKRAAGVKRPYTSRRHKHKSAPRIKLDQYLALVTISRRFLCKVDASMTDVLIQRLDWQYHLPQ